MAETVLITTHDLESAMGLRSAFQESDYSVELLTSGEKIRDVEDPILLILTGGLHEKRSRRLGREAAEFDPMPVIALAEENESDPEAMRRNLGASDLFIKPIDLEEVALVGRRLIERHRLQRITGIVGQTEEIREALERVVQFAPVNATVLITGESGTGKELVARGIHALSSRRHRPFIAANVAALSESVLESELFGHEKGSFTGAVAQRKGLFELAHRGTLFLDEIGELPLSTQTKLLRVLEEREFMRVGGEELLTVDVRVITATNQDLRQLVQLGDFRRDLYYRLNVLSIRMPPLRERRDDIPRLTDAFIREAGEAHDRPQVTLSPEAMKILKNYDWPGNVRELRNLVESMVVLAPGRVIGPEDIPAPVRGGRSANLLPATVPRRTAPEGEDTAARPELEFVFRTLLELRMDMEDLKEQFEEFQRRPEETPLPLSSSYPVLGPALAARSEHVHNVEPVEAESEQRADPDEEEEEEEEKEPEGVVVFRPGMKLDDLEREAIAAALREVDGNRREAAELLGIGERTLYRKLKLYDL